MQKTRFIPTGYTRDNITSYYEGKEQHLFDVYTRTDLPTPVAMFFTGKQSNPTWHYRFSNTSDMVKKIKESIDRVISWEDLKVRRKTERQAPHSLKVGDILYSSWGYDQTNIDFYQVIEIVSDKTVKIRQIASKIVGTQGYANDVMPVKDSFLTPRNEHDDTGRVMTKRVSGKNSVKIESYASAWLWDGTSKSETAAGFGH